MSPDSAAREAFRRGVLEWADRIGVAPLQIHIRPMKHKWGSCSTSGRVTFNSELLEEPAEVRAEVIVHELLHLKVPNHGPLFRSLERAYLQRVEPMSSEGEVSAHRRGVRGS